MPQTK